MTVPSGFTNPTGKDNLLASFNKFMISEIEGGEVHDGTSTDLPGGKEFWWLFDYPITGMVFPAISIVEVGLFSQAPRAFDRLLRIDPTTGKPIKGERNQTLIEINCWADVSKQNDAVQFVRQLRDRVNYVLKNAGERDEDTKNYIVNPIDLKDWSEVGEPVVGRILVDTADNSIDEKFLVDPENQNIKRYRLMVRVFWNELL